MNYLKRLALRFVKNIHLDNRSNINYSLKNNGIRSDYPVEIYNSKLSIRQINEGSVISNTFSYGNVSVGRFVTITGPGTIIKSLGKGIEIRDFSSLGQNVCIVDFNHFFSKPSSFFLNHLILKKGFTKDIITEKVVIEEDVFIGSNSVVLPGITLGRGSIIAAGSIVTKNVPRYSVVAGNPAMVKKMRYSDHVIDFLENLEWWTWDTDKIISNEKFFNSILKDSSVDNFDTIGSDEK